MNINKTKDETVKALLKDIKFYDKLLNNVFNWCGKDSLLYWSITRTNKQKEKIWQTNKQ
jgi:hypothetical protein